VAYKLVQKVIDTVGIPVMQKAVLIVLARHSQEDGSNAKSPSVQTLGDKAGMCAKAARVALRGLEEGGWIIALGNKAGGRNQTTRYLIVVGKLGPTETRNDVPGNDEETRHDVPPNGHDTRHDVPGYSAERRYDVPLNPVPRTAEEVLEEKKITKDVDAPLRAQARETAEKVFSLSGLPVTPTNLRTAENWLRQGADPGRDILPAVEAALSRPHGLAIRCFGFFTADVETFQARRLNPFQPKSPTVVPISAGRRPLEQGAAEFLELYNRKKAELS
jgi:hypothetical protein